ncbi:MAG: YebC/PmpR family DNA-binding transcriptional regulator [Rickettsiaceae bacterium]|nr:MAG: YebC/PmpR family DNA-binding transcriptional regulator [Rickettsiaceae bacterium]
MAGHSKFKNIQHRKGAQDKKKAKLFTKLVREIITAAKIGSPDPATNARLRSAIAAARTQNLPKERVDKALNQANDPNNNENYVEIRYEGFAAGGIAIIVEALTDNKNRTASEVRSSFTKFGGHLGETGSVNFMFNHLGIIQYPSSIDTADKILENAIEAGAEDVETNEEYHTIYSAVDKFTHCLEFMHKLYGSPEDPRLGWKACNPILIDDAEKAEKLLKLVDALEDNEDVQQVFGNYILSEHI